MALAVVAVVVLVVWLVSVQVRLSAAYATLIGVLVALILASALLGMLLAARLTPSARTSVLLNVSMRHFAIASGIVAAAFGPAAAAPAGSYGASSWPGALWSPAQLAARVRAGRLRTTSRHHLSVELLGRKGANHRDRPERSGNRDDAPAPAALAQRLGPPLVGISDEQRVDLAAVQPGGVGLMSRIGAGNSRGHQCSGFGNLITAPSLSVT